MIGLKLNEAKKMFFDRERIELAMSKAKYKSLSRAGAFIWQSARGLIKRRKKPSTPPAPPASHTGLLKKNIFFGFDEGTQSVVIGPISLNQKDGTAPHLLEFGGTAKRKTSRWSKRLKRIRKARAYVAHYEARPYMGPALEMNKSKIGSVFVDSVKG